MADTPVETGVPVPTETPKPYTAEDFTEEFNALITRTGFTITFEAALIPRDDNTYSIIVKQAISPVEKK